MHDCDRDLRISRYRVVTVTATFPPFSNSSLYLRHAYSKVQITLPPGPIQVGTERVYREGIPTVDFITDIPVAYEVRSSLSVMNEKNSLQTILHLHTFKGYGIHSLGDDMSFDHANRC